MIRAVLVAGLALLLGTAGAVAGEEAAGKDTPALDDVRVLFPFGVREDGRPERVVRRSLALGRALDRGLQWLAAHQAPSGLWEPDKLGWYNGKAIAEPPEGTGRSIYGVGVTAIATLAFLANGHAPYGDSPYAKHLERALSALVKNQDGEGCIAPRTTQHYIYNHAFATLALVEAYGMSGDHRLLEPARRGLAFLERAQNPGLGWRYGIRPGQSDTSATGCNLMPFWAAEAINRAARRALLEAPLPFPRDVYTGARAWILRMAAPSVGRVGYLQKGGLSARPQEFVETFPAELCESCTAIGLLLLEITGDGTDDGGAALIPKATRLLLRATPRWDAKGGTVDLYYWYYASLALHELGGDAWTRWQQELEATLVAAQRLDTDASRCLGSWDPTTPWGPDGGRIYTTAMALLALATPNHHPHLDEDRSDLVAALEDAQRPVGERLRLLDAVRRYGLEGAAPAILAAMQAPDARVRRHAALATAGLAPTEGVATALVALLADGDAGVRLAAAEALAVQGRAAAGAATALVSALKDAEAGVRTAALRALAALDGDTSANAAAVLPLLDAPELPVRIAAAGALLRWSAFPKGREAVLLGGLEAPTPALRAEAARYLGALAKRTDAAVTALEKRLRDDDPGVRVAAASALARIGYEKALLVDVVEMSLAKEDPALRVAALDLLSLLGEAGRSAVPSAVPLALEGPPPVRIAAARAVAKAGATTPDVLAALHALAADPSPALRAEAERLLAALPAEDAAAIEALGASLSSPSAAVREGAVRGLLPHGADAEGAARDALSLSDERGWEPALRLLATLGPHASVQARHAALAALETATTVPVQAAALRAMGAMHAREPVAVRAVMDRVAAREPAVRDAAIAALGDLAADDKKAFEKLHDLAGALDKEDRDLRLAALRALGRLGEGAQDAMNVFKKGMEEDDEEVRDASITGMAALGRAALKTLIEGMDSASDVYRRSCLKALGLMGAEARSAVPELMDAIENGRNWGVHDYADVLAHIGKKAVGPLKRLLRSDNVYARGAAARALGRIGPDAHSARRALEKLLEDTSKTVRDEAKKALVQIE